MIFILLFSLTLSADVQQFPREVECSFKTHQIRVTEECVFRRRHKMWQKANKRYPEVMFFHPILEPSINRTVSEIGYLFCMSDRLTLTEYDYRQYLSEIAEAKECGEEK